VEISILENPPKVNVWYCRTKGGEFLRHFLRFDVIALGHIDGIQKSFELSEFPEQEIHEYLATKFKRKGQITNHYNQVIHFIKDIKIGDIVITGREGGLRVGRVVGGPEFVRSTLALQSKQVPSKQHTMEHYLRRSVDWIANIEDVLPSKFVKSMTSHQSLFKLTNYRTLIYSLMFPFLIEDGELRTRFTVRQKRGIPAISMSKLIESAIKSGYVTNVTSGIKSSDLNIEDFENYSFDRRDQFEFKAEVSSPGFVELVVQVASTGDPYMYAILIMLFLNGGEVAFGDIKISVNGTKVLSLKNIPPRILEFLRDDKTQRIFEDLKLGRMRTDDKIAKKLLESTQDEDITSDISKFSKEISLEVEKERIKKPKKKKEKKGK
jgi:hypothetical protein